MKGYKRPALSKYPLAFLTNNSLALFLFLFLILYFVLSFFYAKRKYQRKGTLARCSAGQGGQRTTTLTTGSRFELDLQSFIYKIRSRTRYKFT